MNNINKKRIAASFSNAAKSYDKAAGFQRTAGRLIFDKAVEIIAAENLQPKTILDLGCGTGFFTRKLSSQFSSAQIIGLDLSQGMVDFCKQSSQAEMYLCGDVEAIPLEANSVDLMYSNLTFQWLPSLEKLLSEVYRVLKPNGVLVFTSLGVDTLFELKKSWQQVDNHKRINDFLDITDWQNVIFQYFRNCQFLETKKIVVDYERAIDLMRDLKKIGANNLDASRRKGLTSPESIKKVEDFYRQYRMENGKLPATYKLILGGLVKRL